MTHLRRFLTFAMAANLFSSFAWAQAQQQQQQPQRRIASYGVGASFGEYAGLSLYGGLNSGNFVQGTFTANGEGEFAATADYAFAYPGIVNIRGFTPFWGLGIMASQNQDGAYFENVEAAEDANVMGVRVPFGVTYAIANTPVQVSAEVAPTLLYRPSSANFFHGGVNARVVF